MLDKCQWNSLVMSCHTCIWLEYCCNFTAKYEDSAFVTVCALYSAWDARTWHSSPVRSRVEVMRKQPPASMAQTQMLPGVAFGTGSGGQQTLIRWYEDIEDLRMYCRRRFKESWQVIYSVMLISWAPLMMALTQFWYRVFFGLCFNIRSDVL